MEEQNPPETLQTLLKYEKSPNQAQSFLSTVYSFLYILDIIVVVAMFNICSLNLFVARVGKNFKWPLLMPEYLRSYAFENIADLEFKFDDEIGFNIIFFYNSLDNNKFVGHENEWVTVHNQKVIEYGQEYNDDQLNKILEIMPGAIQLPVDQTRLPQSKPAKMVIFQSINSDDYKVRVRIRRPDENDITTLPYDFYDNMNNDKRYTSVVDTGAPETILPYYVKRMLGSKGWSTIPRRAGGYGAPALQIRASAMFEVSIGDDNNWTKWVRAKILLWEKKPGNKVGYALIGNDITNQLAYVHEVGKPIKFLDRQDELKLTKFLRECS
ncbi:4026_t:CDS:2 [Diversispora eburnea]|uniref:4026_t:CDS:1 n=1 Tax=Diversispora eburnea TaxID=1213867 RepID=A0A9N9BM70_9GLOM|nr:4026_t:CDS:2 [Diversispora eburnea]